MKYLLLLVAFAVSCSSLPMDTSKVSDSPAFELPTTPEGEKPPVEEEKPSVEEEKPSVEEVEVVEYDYSSNFIRKIINHGSSTENVSANIVYSTSFRITDPNNGESFIYDYTATQWKSDNTITFSKEIRKSSYDFIYYDVKVVRTLDASGTDYSYQATATRVDRTGNTIITRNDIALTINPLLKLTDTAETPNRFFYYDNTPAFWANGGSPSDMVEFKYTVNVNGWDQHKSLLYFVEVRRTKK